jgi:choline dehydrogenase-like flavoprotein
MEGGGFEPTAESQALYRGELLGLPYSLEGSRLRYFGGTSNHWDGQTRPLDARDFEPLQHHPMNEWPIKKRDLDAYANEAADILDLPDPAPAYDVFAGKEKALLPVAWRMSPPTRFGSKYRQELISSTLISLCLNATLVDIELEAGLHSVSNFLFRSDSHSEPLKVRAKYFVICCGGLENARMLLVANRQAANGVGNHQDLVGRFFCEHIELEVGKAVLKSWESGRGEYIANDDIVIHRQCLSFTVGLSAIGNEAASRADRAVCSLPFSDRLGRAVLGRPPVCHDADVIAVIQQACSPANRVTLSKQEDRFGLKRLGLDWRLTDLDLHTIRTAALEMAHALARHDVGRMQLAPFVARSEAPPADQVIGQNHHMCTTRMSESPSTGVVDRNCRVHGIANLYMGGSSVFASAGLSNPTYTIVQLALRLADHLDAQL